MSNNWKEHLRQLGVPPSMIEEVEEAGRNSNISINFVHNSPGCLRIHFGDLLNDARATRIAKEHLAVVLSSVSHMVDHLDMVKHDNVTIAIDAQICEGIQSGLKNTKELEISYLQHWSTGEVDMLLKHMPSGLSKLKVFEPDPTCSASFRQIPLSLPNLQALEIQGEDDDAISSLCLEEWAVSIGLLTSLESLVIHYLSSKEEDWNPVLLAIQAHPSLTTVNFKFLFTPDHKAIKFDKKKEDSIICRLAINKAKAQLKLEGTDHHGPTLKNWVNVVISSRHQIGCLEYLLSSVDPTIYAPAAIMALQGLTYKRKLDEGADKNIQELKRQRQLGLEERARVFG